MFMYLPDMSHYQRIKVSSITTARLILAYATCLELDMPEVRHERLFGIEQLHPVVLYIFLEKIFKNFAPKQGNFEFTKSVLIQVFQRHHHRLQLAFLCYELEE